VLFAFELPIAVKLASFHPDGERLEHMRLAQKMSRLGTESAFRVLAQAQALEARGIDVIHLEIGEPDYATPANIAEAAAGAVKDGYTHYCNSQQNLQKATIESVPR
jgi:bifunctional pyridoxal-dependent enzyme with beta-cystathionase and maltose regulon repressor activities